MPPLWVRRVLLGSASEEACRVELTRAVQVAAANPADSSPSQLARRQPSCRTDARGQQVILVDTESVAPLPSRWPAGSRTGPSTTCEDADAVLLSDYGKGVVSDRTGRASDLGRSA